MTKHEFCNHGMNDETRPADFVRTQFGHGFESGSVFDFQKKNNN